MKKKLVDSKFRIGDVMNKTYRNVMSSRLSWLVAHSRIFRLFMKGKFVAYVLWPFAKSVQKWIVDPSTASNFMVFQLFMIVLLSLQVHILLCILFLGKDQTLDTRSWDVILSFALSVMSAAFGITKFLKVGPCR